MHRPIHTSMELGRHPMSNVRLTLPGGIFIKVLLINVQTLYHVDCGIGVQEGGAQVVLYRGARLDHHR